MGKKNLHREGLLTIVGKRVGIMQVFRASQATVKAYYMRVRGQQYHTGRNPQGAKKDFENSVNLKIRE